MTKSFFYNAENTLVFTSIKDKKCRVVNRQRGTKHVHIVGHNLITIRAGGDFQITAVEKRTGDAVRIIYR